MRALQISLGLAAGVATGLGVALTQRSKSTRIESTTVGRPKSELELEVDNIKRSVNDILGYVNDIKTESQSVAGTIGDEIKTMISEFQSDINPNIERLQSHIENLQNRGEEITNFPSKK